MGGDKIGFFVNPRAKKQGAQLGGQGISVVAYSEHKDDALQYIKWFAQPDVQKKWWALGGYSCHKAVLEDPGFTKSAPFAGGLPRRPWTWCRTSGPSRSYAQLLLDMQKRVHDYVVADKGTAKEALDSLDRRLDEGVQGRRQAQPGAFRSTPLPLLPMATLGKSSIQTELSCSASTSGAPTSIPH